jgi:hypothetical protein
VADHALWVYSRSHPARPTTRAVPNRRPSIPIANVDVAIEVHLIGRISDLWSPPANPEEDDDLAEALRSDLHGAIATVLAEHGVSVVAS